MALLLLKEYSGFRITTKIHFHLPFVFSLKKKKRNNLGNSEALNGSEWGQLLTFKYSLFQYYSYKTQAKCLLTVISMKTQRHKP